MLISSARPGANAGAAANASPGARFRTALAENPPLAIVGAINPFCAMLAEQAGHQAIYLAGGGMATHSQPCKSDGTKFANFGEFQLDHYE